MSVLTASKMTSRCWRAAWAYADRFGWPVFACRPGDKTPLTGQGFHDASREKADIDRWWRANPDTNVAMPTGGVTAIDVLDIDAAKDGAPGGQETLGELVSEHKPLPKTVETLTPGGGRHIWFKHAEGMTSRARVLPGIDIRADGGYIILPPSTHPNGGLYTFEASSRPEAVPVAEWPPWPLERLRKPAAGACVSPANDITPEGQRNDTLTSLAGSMRRRGMPGEMIRAALQSVNAKCCRPPLPETDLERIAQSVARYPAADAEPGPEWPEPPPQLKPPVEGAPLLDGPGESP